MTSQLLGTLISRGSQRHLQVQQTSDCFGNYIGPINFAHHCWAAKGSIRGRFYSDLKPEILQHLNGWSASVSSDELVVLTVYMIGRTQRTASPTVLFISENDHYRKEARKVIKESGILKQYPGFKTAHIAKDPGLSEQLEQLASGEEEEASGHNDKPATEIFYEPSTPLRQIGMPIYIRHSSHVRPATANAIRLQGRLFCLAPCHSFFERLHTSSAPMDRPEVDFEIDSDSEEDPLDDSITSAASQSLGGWSEEDSSDSETHSAQADNVFHDEPTSQPFDAHEVTGTTGTSSLDKASDRVLPLVQAKPRYSLREILTPPLESLARLGVLVDWSVDQDWALILVEAKGDVNISNILSGNFRDLSTVRLSLSPPDDAEVVAYMASCDPMTGTIAAMPSYIRVPRARSFQEVFSVNLNGPLTDGDCGAAVFNAVSGELFGHIIAGCRTTGFGYVMAAHHVFPELEKSAQEVEIPPIFHNFLRVFCSFHPSHAISDSSVTLPLEEGDVLLVHSVHTNGWADGTSLTSGARGWLPTNYCEAYEPEDIRSLLNALLNFWELLRSASVNDSQIILNQEFMKGIIAGVRFLLERTGCLNRESIIVQRSDALHKGRKSLLSELSSLVKTGKRLQESQNGTLFPPEDVNDIIDEMILRAFKIVTNGVRFLDALEDDRRARACFEDHKTDNAASETSSRATATDDMGTSVASVVTSESSEGVQNSLTPWNKCLSSLNAPISPSLLMNPGRRRNSQGSLQNRRLSAGMAQRVALAGLSPLSKPPHLVSERLSRSHDKFLSHLGLFIGRLHQQSQSRPELSLAIKQSATSGGELLAVIDSVCAYYSSSVVSLTKVRTAMFERIQILVLSARDTLVNAATEGADLIMPQDNGILLMAATGCVRQAGECVAKTKAVMEMFGDFEFELEGVTLGIDLSILDIEEGRARTPPVTERSDVVSSTAESFQTCESSIPAPRRLSSTSDKPLPRVPRISIPENILRQGNSPISCRPSSVNDGNASSIASSVSSVRLTLPPLPKLSTSPDTVEQTKSTIDVARIEQEQQHESRFHSQLASSAGSCIESYLGSDAETSVASENSTCATTQDHALVPRNRFWFSDMDLSAPEKLSQTGEQYDVETMLLDKTFAHELMFNMEGQVTGGSLCALVERLTTHESVPDAAFVSTFFLTFRLFCTPNKLTEALIERFDLVSEFSLVPGPVRWRVYNAFKGWLESHWRDPTDRDALRLIVPFAELKLSSVLPSAGRRLLELASRVSRDGSLVPRLVASMGKTTTAIAQYVPTDPPLPQPAISKSQQHMLTIFRTGGNGPTLLDLDPVEIARQLTIKQMGIFCSILPEELLASQWMKKGGVDALNVRAMLALSTGLSNLVAETILQQSETKKRAALIKQWIKVAHQCHELHNYDGLVAIICSLNSSTISQLQKTWDTISSKPKEMLQHLQEIVEPAQNNKVLRTRLDDHVPPCLPFLGMYLTDLTFVDLGNPATKKMSLYKDSGEDSSRGLTIVNFDKHTRTAEIIGELQRFQMPYRLLEVSDMQDWITAQIWRVREGDQGNVQVSYYRKSLLLEPRENNPRRDAEPPTPVAPSARASRGDLFGWMSRDRSQIASQVDQNAAR